MGKNKNSQLRFIELYAQEKQVTQLSNRKLTLKKYKIISKYLK
jgi:hypothetical protein